MSEEFLGESERRLIQQEMFQLEDQKLALEEQYQYLFENALAGLFRIDVKTSRVLTANKELLRTFGVEELVELDYLFHKYRIFEELEELKNDTYSGEESLTFSSPLLIGKEERMIRFSARYKVEYQVIEGAARDITSLVSAEKRMLEAIREAEQANHAKSLFLANMSHEIRTPLNGIVGFAELIQQSGDKDIALYAHNILDESDRLMTLINQLLDISKIEANQIHLEAKPFYLSRLVRDQVNSFMPVLKGKMLDFRLSLDDRLTDCYLGDTFRLGQILTNLISNAVKFTHRGKISLNISLYEHKDNRDWIRFVISDTGIGIPREMQKRVFEKFVQADNSIQRRFGGTGLGVAICKELVELMGGQIALTSREGEGTEFSFTIPLAISQVQAEFPVDEAEEEADLNNLPPARILLVEDYKINQDVVLLHLEPFNMVIDVAENGEEAILLFTRNHYDLIIMDVHMPLLSGLEATTQIRKMVRGKDIPIIGVSASAFTADREACRRVGMSDFLSKPIRRKKLIDHLYFWLSRKENDSLSRSLAWECRLQQGDGDSEELILRYGEFCEDIGSREDGNMIITGFIESARELMEEIFRDVELQKWERSHRNAHSLKGGALSIMADELSEAARALEAALKEPDGRDIMPLYQNVSRSLERLDGYFEKHRIS
ncbi:MAG: response regulator [Spirochaetales bacterium]|nr:response regulator [Spirochaetales bacterium]